MKPLLLHFNALRIGALRSGFACLTLVVCSGCFTINAQLPGTLRGDLDDSKIEKVGTYSYEDTETFFFGYGEVNTNAVYNDLMKRAPSQHADGVSHMRVEWFFTPTDWLISHATCSILSPRSYRVSGDWVRIRERPLPGNKTPSAAPQTF